jgi:hypothetical protein
MRKLTDSEIQQVNGSGSTTYKLPSGASLTITQMRNHSTTFTAQVGSSMYSANSGQQLAKFLIGAGVGAMVLPFVGPVGAFMVGQAASYGAGRLMSSVGGGG